MKVALQAEICNVLGRYPGFFNPDEFLAPTTAQVAAELLNDGFDHTTEFYVGQQLGLLCFIEVVRPSGGGWVCADEEGFFAKCISRNPFLA